MYKNTSAMSRKRQSIDSADADNAIAVPKKSPKRSYTKAGEVIGIPKAKLKKYKEIRKIKEFYPWQLEFLNDIRLIKGESAFLTAGTGGGKTMVAELLILREMMNKDCSAILALPYIALVDEKVPVFQSLAEIFDIEVKEYAGNNHKFPIPKIHRTLFICSYELASIVCNDLKQADRLSEIGLLVLDEIHMVDEHKRGPNLETLLTKYRALIDYQIIAMSATVGNVDEITEFVGGFHYHSPFRPVPLREYIVCNRTVSSVQDDKFVYERVLNRHLPWYGQLAFEVTPRHSVLMFCNSRDACEYTCIELCRNVPNDLETHKSEERRQFIDDLISNSIKEGAPLPKILEKGLENGIAYHHSHLSKSQRKSIEQAYRDGIVSIICSTTTLAAGVNLPVRRVIIKSAKIGSHIMDKTHYLQMAGRAGRAGLDDVGESFILIDENPFRVKNLVLNDPVPECVSRLKLEPFVLNLVPIGHDTEDKLKYALNKTLFVKQNPEATEILEQTIVDLKEPSFLLQNSQAELSLSPLTNAALCLRIDPRQISPLINYFSTFNNSHFSIIEYHIPKKLFIEVVNVELFQKEYLKLDEMSKQLLPEFSAKALVVFGKEPSKYVRRFYAALVIYRLFKDKMDLAKCAEIFDITPACLHRLCKSVYRKIKSLKRAVHMCEEMTPMRKPVVDVVDFLAKFNKKL